MSRSFAHGAGAGKANPVGPDLDREVSVDVLEHLREAIARRRWKHEALAAHLSEKTNRCIDGAYLSKMLSGEKAITAVHLSALPDDIDAEFTKVRAEARGMLVIAPHAGQDAMEAFLSVIYTTLLRMQQFPQPAMAKASMRRRAGEWTGEERRMA